MWLDAKEKPDRAEATCRFVNDVLQSQKGEISDAVLDEFSGESGAVLLKGLRAAEAAVLVEEGY